MHNQLVIFLQENLIKYNNEKNLCLSHSDINQQQYNFCLISAFCLLKKGLKLTWVLFNFGAQYKFQKRTSKIQDFRGKHLINKINNSTIH